MAYLVMNWNEPWDRIADLNIDVVDFHEVSMIETFISFFDKVWIISFPKSAHIRHKI